MQSKRDQKELGMMLLPPLESFIPEDYRLRKLNKVLDLSFIHEAVRGHYCQDNGRPSVDPEVVIRLFLLQAMEGIRSVRELMREVQVNLGYRWFIGYSLEENLPDHSTLSKALDRFGDEVFNGLFERSIEQCRASGLIEGKVLHVDATTIRADMDRYHRGDGAGSDKDARVGRFPGGDKLPGYKQQTVVDDHKGVILSVGVTPADRHDHDGAVEAVDAAMEHLAGPPEAVCADAAYGSGQNRAAMEARGVRLISPPPKVPQGEYFSADNFRYDEKNDCFICPAGAVLRCLGRVKARPRQKRYISSKRDCQRCGFKERCTTASRRQIQVSAHHAALIRLRIDSHTDSFRRLYRRRAPVIEGLFAEAKNWHGLRRAWRRGLPKMCIQCLLIAAVINFKRLMTAFLYYCHCESAAIPILRRIIDRIKPNRYNFVDMEKYIYGFASAS